MKQYNKNLPARQMLGEEPAIAENASIINCFIGKYTEIMENTVIEESVLGDYSYLCDHCNVIYADIGKFASIASMVRINPGNHPFERPSLHHFTYRGNLYGFCDTQDDAFFNWRRLQRVCIGHDTWIGHGSVILPGVRIGNGAVVGSLSVVTRDVEPYTIVGGSPARRIKKRFPRAIAERIEKSAWWDWAHETLRERFADFRDIRLFLHKYC